MKFFFPIFIISQVWVTKSSGCFRSTFKGKAKDLKHDTFCDSSWLLSLHFWAIYNLSFGIKNISTFEFVGYKTWQNDMCFLGFGWVFSLFDRENFEYRKRINWFPTDTITNCKLPRVVIVLFVENLRCNYNFIFYQ